MNPVVQAAQDELIKYMPAIFASVFGAGGLLMALIGWARAHFTASAVRQAVEYHGDNLVAEQKAADELQRAPTVLRPKNITKAVAKAAEKQRDARASKAPPAP